MTEIERLDRALAQAQGQLLASERERNVLREWRMDVTVALGRQGGAHYEDVPQHVRDLKAKLAASERAREALEQRARDADLQADNAEIALQQELHREQVLGAALEGLSFWPSPNADMHRARDIGRVLQGKPAEWSTPPEIPAPMVRSWKSRAETAEAQLTAATRTGAQLRAQIEKLPRYDMGGGLMLGALDSTRMPGGWIKARDIDALFAALVLPVRPDTL